MHDSDRRQRIHHAHPDLRRNIIADLLRKCNLNKRSSSAAAGGLNGAGIAEGHIKVSVNQQLSDTQLKALMECVGGHYSGIPIKFYPEPKPVRKASGIPFHLAGELISDNPFTGNAGQTTTEEYTEYGMLPRSKTYPTAPDDPNDQLNVYDIVRPYHERFPVTSPLDYPPVHPASKRDVKADTTAFQRVGLIGDPYYKNLAEIGSDKVLGGGTSTGCLHDPEYIPGDECEICTITAVVKDRVGKKYFLSNAHCFKLPGQKLYIAGRQLTTVRTATKCGKKTKNHLDASLVPVPPDWDDRVTFDIYGLNGPPVGVQEPEIGMKVMMSGKERYQYPGTINVVNYSTFTENQTGFPTVIDPVTLHITCETNFEDVFQIPGDQKFGIGGDSGAPVYNPITRTIVGIFFGKVEALGDKNISVCCSAKYIEPELGVTFGPPDRFFSSSSNPNAFSEEYVKQYSRKIY